MFVHTASTKVCTDSTYKCAIYHRKKNIFHQKLYVQKSLFDVHTKFKSTLVALDFHYMHQLINPHIHQIPYHILLLVS